MKTTQLRLLLPAAVALFALLPPEASAAKKGKGGGGGGKGGYARVDLPDASGAAEQDGYASGMREIKDAQGALNKRTGVVSLPTLTLRWQGEQATDLQAETTQDDPELTLKSMAVVSDAGWMAGFGWNSDTDPRAIVLAPK